MDIPKAFRNESIAVRHFDRWQALGVQHQAFGNDDVAIENESRQGVNVAGPKRTFLFWWHGAIDVIPYCRGKGPVISKRPRGRRRIERASASDQARSELAALPGRSVAGRAFARVNLLTLFGGAAS